MDSSGIGLYGRSWIIRCGITSAVALLLAGLPFATEAYGATFRTFQKFCQTYLSCPKGSNPSGGLTMDAAGNLYGTTSFGGTGAGTVFELVPEEEKLIQKVLYNFCTLPGCADGKGPAAGPLIMDMSGNLYGTTFGGGTGSGCPSGDDSCGTVFELVPDGEQWTEKVLYSFCTEPGCADGGVPGAGLIMDASGDLYGTTRYGGASNKGTVFRLAPDGTETVLYSFCTQPGCADGAEPRAGLLMDASGNLYGTTYSGGTGAGCDPGGCVTLCVELGGCGTVFSLAPNGTETVLYNFCTQSACADGAAPEAGLIMDASGILYGVTTYGGGSFQGTVFELAPDGTETVLHSFDGTNPAAELIMDASGKLYGTAVGAWYKPCSLCRPAQMPGILYRLQHRRGNWTFALLHTFPTGVEPDFGAGLILDASSDLYGEAGNTVFERIP